MSLFSNVPGALKFLLPLAAGGALAGAIALSAQGDDGRGQNQQPIAKAQETATPLVERTAAPPAPTLSNPSPQEQKPVAPVPALQGGRPDCPTDWLIWREVPKGRFSICYPASVDGGIEALSYISGTRGPDEVLWLHTPFTTNRDTADVVFSLTVSLGPRTMLRPTGEGCPGLVPAQRTNGMEGALTIAGRSARTCQAAGQDFIQGRLTDITELLVEIPLDVGSDRLFLKIVATYHSGPESPLHKAWFRQ